MAIAGVKGIALSRDPIGNSAILVYVVDQASAKQMPRQLDGIPVITQVTGEIDAL
jgi:hypothetical protein